MLSPREREIMTYIAKGYLRKEVARELGISPATVRAHLVRIYNKIDANNAAHATAILLTSGEVKVERNNQD